MGKKKEKGLKITKRRDGRYAVQKPGGKYVNGEEKVKALVNAGHVKPMAAKKAEGEGSSES